NLHGAGRRNQVRRRRRGCRDSSERQLYPAGPHHRGVADLVELSDGVRLFANISPKALRFAAGRLCVHPLSYDEVPRWRKRKARTSRIPCPHGHVSIPDGMRRKKPPGRSSWSDPGPAQASPGGWGAEESELVEPDPEAECHLSHSTSTWAGLNFGSSMNRLTNA